MKRILLVLPFIFLLSQPSRADRIGSDQVTADVIYQSFKATYFEDTRKLEATATFHVSDFFGTTIKLVAPSSVAFDGLTMTGNDSVWGYTNYKTQIVRAPNVPLPGTFVWSHEGKTYTNALTMLPVIPVNLPAKISRNAGLTIEWQGGPLREGESVSIGIIASEGSGLSQRASTVGQTSVSLTASDLSSLKAGSASISFTRSITVTPTSATPKGGLISATYFSKSFKVTVTN